MAYREQCADGDYVDIGSLATTMIQVGVVLLLTRESHPAMTLAR